MLIKMRSTAPLQEAKAASGVCPKVGASAPSIRGENMGKLINEHYLPSKSDR